MGRIKSLNNAGKFILRTDKTPNSKNEHQIYIQYTLDRRVAKAPTDVWVKETEWNSSKEQVSKKSPKTAPIHPKCR